MKYIRTYETEEKFLADKDSTSRGFRLKPTLYKYSEAGDHVHLELDDPRKHGDSTYIEITLSSNKEFMFYIGNKSGDKQTTMKCTVDWGDGTVETKTIDGEEGFGWFMLSHNYVAGSYKIELYNVERDYITVGDSMRYSPIYPRSSVRRIILDEGNNYDVRGVVSIGEYSLFECSSLTSVSIPESVTSIGNAAFNSCSSLTSVSIPESVTSIGESAFYNCTSLTSINIPNNVNSIKYYTFQYCSSLTSINIPNSVNSIEGQAFERCTSLTSISSFNPTAPTLDYNTFNGLPKNGTLHIKPGATGYNKWLKQLPSGWTIVESL